MNILIQFLTFTMLLTWCCETYASDETPTNKLDQAYQELLTVRCFAFGGVGIAGTISPGQRCFETISLSTNRAELFRSAITNGTTEARLYALVGIKRFAPDEFEKNALRIASENMKVTEMNGCLVSINTTSNIVQRIRSGQALISYPSRFQTNRDKATQ